MDNINPLLSYLSGNQGQQPQAGNTGVLAPGQNNITHDYYSSEQSAPTIPGVMWQGIPVNQLALKAQDAAISNPHATDGLAYYGAALDGSSWNGLCEAYAGQQAYGHTKMYPTAISAWNAYSQQGQAQSNTTKGIQKGDLVYFGADTSNGGAGHAGIYEGNGEFTSATYNGVKTYNLSDWVKNTGQKFLGYVSPTPTKK